MEDVNTEQAETATTQNKEEQDSTTATKYDVRSDGTATSNHKDQSTDENTAPSEADADDEQEPEQYDSSSAPADRKKSPTEHDLHDLVSNHNRKSSSTASSRKASHDVTFEGELLKKPRRPGGKREKPWKRRWFMISGGTLLYKQSQHASQVKLFCHLKFGTDVVTRTEPVRHISIKTPTMTYSLQCVDEQSHTAWIEKLRAAVGLPEANVDEEDPLDTNHSHFYKFKSFLASTFATSRFGKYLIRHYLDESGRSLIDAVVDFAEVEAGRRKAHELETAIFDIAARIAVIARCGLFPQGLDFDTLSDETLAFCQEFIWCSRDIRLRHLRPEESFKSVEEDKLLQSIRVVVSNWSIILAHNVSKKTVRRFQNICDFYFTDDRVRSMLSDEKHRARMFQIEQCLRTLLETY